MKHGLARWSWASMKFPGNFRRGVGLCDPIRNQAQSHSRPCFATPIGFSAMKWLSENRTS